MGPSLPYHARDRYHSELIEIFKIQLSQMIKAYEKKTGKNLDYIYSDPEHLTKAQKKVVDKMMK